MWIDTDFMGTRRLLNMENHDAIFIDFANRQGTAYSLKLGAGTFGGTLGVFPDLDAAVAEFEKICDAVKRGDCYYKVSTFTHDDGGDTTTDDV